MKVLNFGSLNIDYVYSVDHMVMPGETLATDELNIFCGGKGLNQSIALAKAGSDVYHAGMTGDDGDILIEALKESGCDVSFVRKTDVKSGHTIIQVDREGENCILLHGGANKALTEEYVDSVLSEFGEGDILVVQNETNLLSYIIDRAFERGMKTVLNPSPYNETIDQVNMNRVSMVIINRLEGENMAGTDDESEIIDKLSEKYPDMKIVLTLGRRGAAFYDGKNRYFHSAYNVEAVDTTGAGDTFTGYFITAVSEGMEPEEALGFAQKASALAVQKEGAAPSIPSRKEVSEAELDIFTE